MSVGLKLYGYPGATCTNRCLLAANELGIELDLQVVDLMKGEQKTPAHLARQPFGKIPVLEDGDFSFYESRAIVTYLIRKYGASSGLLPTDVQTLARYDQWASIEATVITPELITIFVQRIRGKLRPNFVFDQKALESAVSNLQTPLDVLNKWFETNAYLAGDKYSALDIILIPYAAPVFDSTEEGKEFLAARPHLAAYWKRVSDRPAWQKIVAAQKH